MQIFVDLVPAMMVIFYCVIGSIYLIEGFIQKAMHGWREWLHTFINLAPAVVEATFKPECL